ncbi:MAG TPA: hypothetical protein VLI92_01880 [Candidatus Saccharimonadales bacterium]|nr:hypothetical protein [Candidatus Saccharimonadales bacterium]
MSKKAIKFLVMALVLISLGLATAKTAFADKPSGDTRPGWGFGDKNHVHTGPPGQSNHP